MNLSPEDRANLVDEIKRLGSSLNLSDDQKQKLQTFMTEAREKVQAYKEANPNVTQQDLVKQLQANRASLRERLVNFLTPEQLSKWDTEIAKAREFLGQKAASA